MRAENSKDMYVTVGVVAIVALVAAWFILGNSPFAGWSTQNLRGQADLSIYPLILNPEPGTPFSVGSATVMLDAVSATRASIGITLTPDGPLRSLDLPLGGSISIGDFTLTFMAGDAAGRTGEFQVSQHALVCGARDAQEQLCAGNSACCGGTCVELPDCDGATDGPIGSCGERQFYCCAGALGFSACTVGGTQ